MKTLRQISDKAFALELTDEETHRYEIELLTLLGIDELEVDVYKGTQIIGSIMKNFIKMMDDANDLLDSHYMSAKDAMKLLNVTRNTLQNYVNRGLISHNENGRDYDYQDVMTIYRMKFEHKRIK